jgi:hypothetical protein
MAGEQLDLSSDPPRRGEDDASAAGCMRFVGVNFACCGVYSRVYRNREATAYVGYCPKCSRPVRLKIGPGGSDARFFTAQ